MLTILVGCLLALLLFGAISLQKTYNHVPVKELKRQAKQGDDISKLFYRAVAYGLSLDVFLWLWIGVVSAILLVFLSRVLPWPVALFGAMSVIWFGFAWLPNSHISSVGVRFARLVTPPLVWLLDQFHPILIRLGNVVNRWRPITMHTGLYDKQDLLDNIKQQQKQIDNRIDKEELQIAERALTFGDKPVGSLMIPWKKAKIVSTHDVIGPVLMGELHDTGYAAFPVHQDKNTNIVGMLFLRDMVEAKAGGFVKNIMKPQVYYINEQQKLANVLEAFAKTKQHIYVVINNFEEIVGLITVDDVLEQIAGKPLRGGFDNYENLQSVAHVLDEKPVDEVVELDEQPPEPTKTPGKTDENVVE